MSGILGGHLEFKLQPFSEGSKYAVSGQIECNNNQLFLNYCVDGPIEELLIKPPVSSLRRQQNLWKTSCFELFCKMLESEKYVEYNFSPYRAFSADVFKAYRKYENQHNSTTQVLIRSHITPYRLSCRVKIVTSNKINSQFSELSPCMVLQTTQTQEFWALSHGSQKPDFHRFHSVLRL